MTTVYFEFPYIVSDRSATAFVNNKTYTANNTHPNFSQIVESLKTGVDDVTKFTALFDIVKTIESVTEGRVSIQGDNVFYGGTPIHSTLTARMVQMVSEGFNVTPLIHFMENLFQNPSYRCVNSVYDFLEANDVPITPDGCVLMYKKVRDSYKDIHSNTFDNSIGKILVVPRNQVDENIDKTCSYGLHVCAEGYLRHFSISNADTDRVVICKVNPRDIVANPRDYNNAKLRVCRYEVVGEVPKDQTKDYFRSIVMDGTESWDIEDDWDTDSTLDMSDDYDYVGNDERVVVINGVDVTFVLNENDYDGDHFSVTFIHPLCGEVITDTIYENDLEAAISILKGSYISLTRTYLLEVRGFDTNGNVVDRIITVEEECLYEGDEPLTTDDFLAEDDLYISEVEYQAPEIVNPAGVFIRSLTVGEVQEVWAE